MGCKGLGLTLPPMQNPSLSLLSQDGWAEVRARDHVVRYRRSGSGQPALLLYSATDNQGLWPEVIEALAAGFRLIVPSPPAPGTDAESWLATVIEGLGVPNLTVIVTEAFGLAPLEAIVGRCDQVARIVFVAAGAGVGVSASRTSTPLLVLQRERPADEILPALMRFLGRNGDDDDA